MDILETARIIRFHQKRIKSHGDYLTPGLKRDQHLRFEMLCRWGDFSGLTLLDLGCGFGDLKAYLDSYFSDFTYLGVDLVKEAIDRAQKRFSGAPNTHFLNVDFLTNGLPKVDLIIASGSLNYCSANQLHPWSSIRNMWEAATMGIAFNVLDAARFNSNGVLCGYPRHEVWDFCRSLDPNAEIIDDYLTEEMTLLLRKNIS